ncbi:hypothetical protein [Rhodococcus sp. PD04]|uniref:hypothetical protein n=1 Tax=Rhodococcus sp. PD04 TaxID=3109594 RepID=UPI002DDB065D|nr:hypothetical protein [Rhodococcus sp. PD04]WSE22357.1 hypothetical protein U9J23_22330 [Rhodococcus sp. PD04]
MTNTAPAQQPADIAAAVGVARFFRAAADRIKAHDEFSERITAAKRRLADLDPVENTREWSEAVVELVELVVEYRSR